MKIVKGFDQTAGPCVDGKRHRWRSGEILVHRGVISRRYAMPCRCCLRVKIKEYTRRGNHTAGYTTEAKP